MLLSLSACGGNPNPNFTPVRHAGIAKPFFPPRHFCRHRENAQLSCISVRLLLLGFLASQLHFVAVSHTLFWWLTATK